MAKDRKQDQSQSEPLRDTGEGLLGDTSEDRNLSGSTTWRTIPDQGPDAASKPEQEPGARGGKKGSGSADERTHGKRSETAAGNPPRTTSGGLTSPKFGSAGSGGAELEPGPERD